MQPLLGHTVLHLQGSTVVSDRTYRGSTIARGQSDLEERTERNGGGQELAEGFRLLVMYEPYEVQRWNY